MNCDHAAGSNFLHGSVKVCSVTNHKINIKCSISTRTTAQYLVLGCRADKALAYEKNATLFAALSTPPLQTIHKCSKSVTLQ